MAVGAFLHVDSRALGHLRLRECRLTRGCLASQNGTNRHGQRRYGNRQHNRPVSGSFGTARVRLSGAIMKRIISAYPA
jgi:hypothetical protein